MFFPGQKTLFAQRDTVALAAAFANLPAHWQQNKWLHKNNRYAKKCIPKLTIDFTPGAKIKHKHLAEYVAASTIMHCMDGWSYLGRALHAQLTGDHDCARHLAYYAELRAAMGLLASQGIGVFSSEHVAVSKKQKCLQFPPLRNANEPTRPRGVGTHVFVWDALEEWSTSSSSTAVILDIVSAGGSPLQDWLNHFGAIPALANQLTKDWLLAWGLDISRLADDRDARNLSSYRPTSISTCRSPSPEIVLRFISGLWRQCEPKWGGPFTQLDQCLVRLSLERAFRAAFHKSPKRAKKQFESRIEGVLHGLQPKAVAGLNWMNFFCSTQVEPAQVLSLAADSVGPDDPEHSLQVASRALLLLRLTSGVGNRLLRSLPAASTDHLSFWISAVGSDRALWPPNHPPTASIDLWSDAEAALNEIHVNLDQVDSFNTLWRRFANSAVMLASWERVGLWGLGL